MKKNVCLCVSLFVAVVSMAAAERLHFDSERRDGAITVDGKFDDWYGNLQPFGDAPVSVQTLNDGEFLYLRLTASDPGARRQILRQGMTVWFDPQGGTKKKLGIRYPVVEAGSGTDEGRGHGGYGGGGRGGHGQGEHPEGGAEDAVVGSDRVDVLGPGKDDARSLTRDHLSGLDVAIRAEQGTLQYELKIPLARSADHPYAIDTQAGKTIGLGIETAKMPQHSSGAAPGGGFGGGGMGGGGMGGHGGGGMGGHGGGGHGGRGGESGSQPPKPLKGWATVTIAPVR